MHAAEGERWDIGDRHRRTPATQRRIGSGDVGDPGEPRRVLQASLIPIDPFGLDSDGERSWERSSCRQRAVIHTFQVVLSQYRRQTEPSARTRPISWDL